MRLLHVFFALGAFISPLLAAGFLLEESSTQSAASTPSTHANMTLETHTADDLMLLYPYLLISILMALTSVTLLIIRLLYHEREPHRTRMQHLTLCPTHGIGELFTDKDTPVEAKLCRIIHPDVSRIVNAHVERNVSHVTQTTSPTCAKCNRVRRFTFSNNGNALTIVSNSSNKKTHIGHTSENSNFTSRDGSPFASPLSSPFTSPLPARRVKDDVGRSASITSDCSACKPSSETPLPNQSMPVVNDQRVEEKKVNTIKFFATFVDPAEPQRECKILVIVLSALFLHFYCGLEASFGSFISPFAITSPLHMSKRAAALVSSVYWGAFAFSRVLMFFFVSMFDSKSWILLNVFLCLLSNVFLVPFASQYQWALWIGSIIMGIGLNAIWLSTFGYIEQFMPVTSKIMVTFTCSAYSGQMLIPSMISPFIEAYPFALMCISFAYSLAMLLFLTAIIYLCSYKLSKTDSSTQSLSLSHTTNTWGGENKQRENCLSWCDDEGDESAARAIFSSNYILHPNIQLVNNLSRYPWHWNTWARGREREKENPTNAVAAVTLELSDGEGADARAVKRIPCLMLNSTVFFCERINWSKRPDLKRYKIHNRKK